MRGIAVTDTDFKRFHRLCPPAECMGKEPYASKAEAIKRIQRARKRHSTKGHKNGWGKGLIFSPYRCPHCHQWHVGATDREKFGQKRKVF